jgi:2-phospho-L-lactate guanylyltransferase
VTVEPFVVLVPVKALSAAKTRLGLDGASTRLLMRAFAEDALATVVQSPLVARVVVVSNEAGIGRGLDLEVLRDEGAGDLNQALAIAARRVRSAHPALGVAALCADLPCLVEPDLTRALIGGVGPRWFVADAQGSGTTLLAAVPGTDLEPHFGAGSAAHHAASGAVAVAAGVPTLRLDVDTTADLEQAVALGVGARTAEALAVSGLPVTRC